MIVIGYIRSKKTCAQEHTGFRQTAKGVMPIAFTLTKLGKFL